MEKTISIRGARVHNLKNIALDKTVITASYSLNIHTKGNSRSYNCTNSSIHTRSVSTAG